MTAATPISEEEILALLDDPDADPWTMTIIGSGQRREQHCFPTYCNDGLHRTLIATFRIGEGEEPMIASRAILDSPHGDRFYQDFDFPPHLHPKDSLEITWALT